MRGKLLKCWCLSKIPKKLPVFGEKCFITYIYYSHNVIYILYCFEAPIVLSKIMLLDLMKNTVWHIYSHQGQSNTICSGSLWPERTFRIVIFFPFTLFTKLGTNFKHLKIFLICLLWWKAHKNVNISYPAC